MSTIQKYWRDHHKAENHFGSTHVSCGFVADVLDSESDDTEFLHFASQEEAVEAAKSRAALSRHGEGK